MAYTANHAIVRPLTTAEVDSLISGSGWPGSSWGHALPSGETNTDCSAYRFRGLYPNPGEAMALLRSDPIVESGLDKSFWTICSLNWEILPYRGDSPGTQDDTTPEDRERSNWIRSGYRKIEPGFLGALRRQLSDRIWGFSLQEIVLDLDEVRGWWYLKDLLWVAPWTIQGWITDKAGRMAGALLKDETGLRPILADKLIRTACWDFGRNLEGISKLRPLRYTCLHKKQVLVDDAAARDLTAAGLLVATPPPGVISGQDDTTNTEFEDVETAVQNIRTGESDAYLIMPRSGWDLDVKFSTPPSNAEILGYLDHQVATGLTDVLSELGQTKYGARAIGTELRLDKWSQLAGVCADLSHQWDRQIHARIYKQNNWDVDRMCRVTVSGLQSEQIMRRIMEYLTTEIPDRPVLENTPAIREQLLRNLGLEV